MNYQMEYMRTERAMITIQADSEADAERKAKELLPLVEDDLRWYPESEPQTKVLGVVK